MEQGDPGVRRIGRSDGSPGIGSPSPRTRNGEPCWFLALQAMGDGQQRPTPVPGTALVAVQGLYEGYPRFGVAFTPCPGTGSGSHKFVARLCSARQAVQTPIPSCAEMTRHEATAARSVATCAATTAARGRPDCSPLTWRVAVLHTHALKPTPGTYLPHMEISLPHYPIQDHPRQ